MRETKGVAAARSTLSPISRSKTTAEEVEERLILAIARGDKSPGERIIEAELASALGVSRVPVREAMQKLQLRGILESSNNRGLRVLDYSAQRIAELSELRFAVERIIFSAIMKGNHKKDALSRELNHILEVMADLSSSNDPVALSSADLDFHRTVARYSGNVLAAQVWEGLAQHLLIVICRDWSRATNRAGEVALHQELLNYIEHGSPGDLDAVLAAHFIGPDDRAHSS